MIIKAHEINKINLKVNPYCLLYGKNEGLKNNTIITLAKNLKNTSSYEEKEILDNSNSFLDDIYSKSLFDSEKIIIIKRATDKILSVLKEIIDKDPSDTVVIIDADVLEKKSKLRTFFEKEKKCVCIPFYPDSEQTLFRVAQNYLKEKKFTISSSDINIIVGKSNGDRQVLLSELEKLEYYGKFGKKIDFDTISKLTNLIENHSILELVDNCLVKNKKKTLKILVENNFSTDDCILITRTFLNKSKKILKLTSEYEKNNDIDLTISSAKPPIFWKEKEITKEQILKWQPDKIKKVIYKLNEIELMIKKNIGMSTNLVTDFILNQVSSETSN